MRPRRLTMVDDDTDIACQLFGGWLLEDLGLVADGTFPLGGEATGTLAAVVLVHVDFVLGHGDEDGDGGGYSLLWVVRDGRGWGHGRGGRG